MLGGMFAGHDESGGELIEKNGKKFKQFYGMASKTAMTKYSGGGDLVEYRSVLCFSQIYQDGNFKLANRCCNF